MVHILSQLGDEYGNIVAAIKVRETALSYSELFDKLLDFERELKETTEGRFLLQETFRQDGTKKQCLSTTLASASSLLTANYTSRQQGRQPSHGFSQRNQKNSPNVHQKGTSRPQWANFQTGRNRQNPNRNTAYCHYCNIPGHPTKECRKLSRFLREHNISIATTSSPNPVANVTTTGSMQPNWFFDTGASNHVTFDPSSLQNVSKYGGPDEIQLGNGTQLPIFYIGSTHITTPLKTLSLPDILKVPNLKRNLISVAKLCKTNKVSVEFFASHFLVKDLRTGAPLMRGENTDDVYHATISSLRQLHFTTINKSLHWHHKLGHPSDQDQEMNESVLQSTDPDHRSEDLLKTLRSYSKNHQRRLSAFTDTKVHKDSLFSVPSVLIRPQGNCLLTSSFAHHAKGHLIGTNIYPMRHKSDVAKLFPQFKILVENFLTTLLCLSLRTMGGGEYLGLLPFLQTNGISHYTTPPHTPEQNGIAERRHRHVVETGLSLLHYAKLPLQYWSHAFQTAVYLINRPPTTTLENKSPFQILFHQPPNYSRLKPFGCLCYPWLKPYNTSKLQPRSSPCIFLGYSTSKSSYKCLDLATNHLYHSRHVQFVEDNFPFHHHSHSATLPTTNHFKPNPTTTYVAPQHPSTFSTLSSSSPTPTQLPNSLIPSPLLPSLHPSPSHPPNNTPSTTLNSLVTPNCHDSPSPTQQHSSNSLPSSSPPSPSPPSSPSPTPHTPTTSHTSPPSPPAPK
ncbi:hypothetical protein OSB04_025644 [Centaurea solstitialis]|uniref:Integrase catalytic domain-containing protein n=1 Tax=Centaurea solstitialis TaxID=347529 RepID=A0AA38T6W8_9ASTR|nr:hypothetical protein OSB04_025644 [Centaurea solstitialis]